MKPEQLILLVEDDPFDVESIKRAFAVHKLRNPVRVASDGIEAMEYLRNQGKFEEAKENPRPSLIVMDLNMPRMGGKECLAELKADPKFRLIPVVILTSSEQEADVAQSYEKGAASYIVKPVTFTKLVEAIKAFELYWTISEVP